MQLHPEEVPEAPKGHRFEGDGYPLRGWWPTPRAKAAHGSGRRRGLLLVDYDGWRAGDCEESDDYSGMCHKCEGVNGEALVMTGGRRNYDELGERCVGTVSQGRFRRDRRLPGAWGLGYRRWTIKRTRGY